MLSGGVDWHDSGSPAGERSFSLGREITLDLGWARAARAVSEPPDFVALRNLLDAGAGSLRWESACGGAELVWVVAKRGTVDLTVTLRDPEGVDTVSAHFSLPESGLRERLFTS